MPKTSSSKKESVLLLLERSGSKGVLVQTLIRKHGSRSPARIFDLRKDGFKITTEPSRGPACRYVLISKRATGKKVVRNGKKQRRA